MGNPLSYFEITTKSDAAALQKFYGDMFGWQINVLPQMGGYGLVSTGGEVGGGIGPAQSHAGVRVYFHAEDLNAALEKAESLGGKIVMQPTKISDDFGSFAVFTDPDGNEVGLWDRPGLQG
ncbi:VOC family protein [Saccharothrix syringae]|uniref:VOC family protein n=1 Tax=Saccharothrix syringae TaxID=103733 RepID=A0A5Q0GY68_SACSY|nr:VOC family protein [Saccharothrix syringae]QFZ18302.1 VOC family protein [Saccharothrix syringae]